MNKSVFWSLLGFMVCMLTFTACSSDNDINATGISLSEKDILLEKGSSHLLKAVVSPENATNKDVKWATSDADIASVDNKGNVTALKTGTATITVSLINGNFTAQCKVTVSSTVSGVSLDKTSLSIIEGKTDILVATILPNDATNKEVKWTSDNESVAKVSPNGEITAIRPGSATITVTTTDQSKTAQCKVTVTPVVSGVTLNKTSLSITEGKTDMLVATILPNDATNKEVTWTSDNESVAKVSPNGEITAIRPGSATITVTTTDQSKTAQCKVTVTPVVSGVTLNKTSLSITEGKTDMLVATILPNDATNKEVTWTSDNKSVAKVSSNGEITAIKPGIATITVTTTDQNKTAHCKVTVTSSKNINYKPYGNSQNW
ncbi:MAG TPA: hypothetical protein DCS83_04745 [Prevotella sp.]|nr:hypothetical protein [Prevotella sp.]